jgi:Mn2+/Fe2+ NRAMP family transporter
MVGTTVSVFAFLIRSGQVKEHGWTMEHWRMQKRDALVSASMMFILSAAVLLTATATLHAEGLKMNSISEMIPMLHPMFGDAAMAIFVVGVLAAGISSHMPNMMVIPWLARDMRGSPRAPRTRALGGVFLLLTAVSILGAVLETRPVFLLLLSQAGISLVMPLALLGLIWLSAHPDRTGAHRPSKVEWLLLGLIAIFSLVMSYLAFRGLITDLQKLFS